MRDEPRTDAEPAPTSMTWPRWRLVFLLMAICFSAHFNRISMAVAGDMRIMEEYALSPTRMGSVYSAFLLAYTLFMIPGGWLIDRRGPRVAMQVVCLGSAVFVVLTGCVGLLVDSGALALTVLLATRSLMGALSAPLHPAAARAVSLHVPVLARSMANGLITGAALLGVAVTYLLFGQLIVGLGWPRAFIVAGFSTAAIGWLWTFYTRALPTLPAAPHAATTASAGPKLDRDTVSRTRHRSAASSSWLHRSKNLLLLTASYAAVGYFQYLFFYWVQFYFQRVLTVGEERSQFYATIPPLVMALGMPAGGWLSDRIRSRYGWRAAHSGLAMVAMSTSAALLLVGVSSSEPIWSVAWLSLALGALGAAEGPFWVTAVEVGGRRGGLSAAIFNTGGNAGGMLAPVVTPWISDALGFGWQTGFAISSGVCLLGAACWYWIDVTPPSLPEASPPPADPQSGRHLELTSKDQ
jgi:MFS family permease